MHAAGKRLFEQLKNEESSSVLWPELTPCPWPF